jgi:hypothetical protein
MLKKPFKGGKSYVSPYRISKIQQYENSGNEHNAQGKNET